MNKLNFNLIRENILSLMKKNDMTQTQLADILGMTQSNVSKCLSKTDDSSRFTAEQLYMISEHFNVTLDWLYGRNDEKSFKYSQQDIGRFIAALLEHDIVMPFKVKITEDVFEPDYYEPDYSEPRKSKENTYVGLYFPSYESIKHLIKDAADDYECQELQAEFEAVGNETLNIRINEFIPKYLEILKVYKNKQISEEAFRIVVKDYLGRLLDYEGYDPYNFSIVNKRDQDIDDVTPFN